MLSFSSHHPLPLSLSLSLLCVCVFDQLQPQLPNNDSITNLVFFQMMFWGAWFFLSQSDVGVPLRTPPLPVPSGGGRALLSVPKELHREQQGKTRLDEWVGHSVCSRDGHVTRWLRIVDPREEERSWLCCFLGFVVLWWWRASGRVRLVLVCVCARRPDDVVWDATEQPPTEALFRP